MGSITKVCGVVIATTAATCGCSGYTDPPPKPTQEPPVVYTSLPPTPTAQYGVPAVPGVVRREDLVLKTRGQAATLLDSGAWKPEIEEMSGFPGNPEWKGSPVLDDSWTVMGACFSTQYPTRVYLVYRPSETVTPDRREAARNLEWSTPAAIGTNTDSGFCDINKNSIDLRTHP